MSQRFSEEEVVAGFNAALNSAHFSPLTGRETMLVQILVSMFNATLNSIAITDAAVLQVVDHIDKVDALVARYGERVDRVEELLNVEPSH